MTLALCLKTQKRGTKGISSVIGTVFLLLIVFAVSANIFLWTITQSSLFNQATRDLDQKTSDRMRESVVATNGNYTWIPGGVKIVATLTNQGSVAARIINLWVFDPARQTYGFNNAIGSLSEANLNPGQVWEIDDSNPLIVNVPDASPSDVFNALFVTARGNTVPLDLTEIILATVAQGIGSISMEYKSFSYYHVGSGNTLGISHSGFTIPGNKTAFAVTLTNFDESHQRLNISRFSSFWLMTPPDSAGAIKGDTWPIAKVVGNVITPFGVNDYLLLPYGQRTTVFFGPLDPKNVDGGKITAANILLFGKIGSLDYGQNIPFIAIYVL